MPNFVAGATKFGTRSDFSVIPQEGPRLKTRRFDFTDFGRNAARANLIMPKVTVLPANVSAEVEPGELLLEAGEKAGVEMEAGCFNCSCGTCVVEVVSGMENLSEPTPEELDVLDSWNKDPETHRLTCCVKVEKGDVVIKAGH